MTRLATLVGWTIALIGWPIAASGATAWWAFNMALAKAEELLDVRNERTQSD